jgi:hypothetical protein
MAEVRVTARAWCSPTNCEPRIIRRSTGCSHWTLGDRTVSSGAKCRFPAASVHTLCQVRKRRRCHKGGWRALEFQRPVAISVQWCSNTFYSTYAASAQNDFKPPARFGPGPALHLENLNWNPVGDDGSYSANAKAHIDLYHPNGTSKGGGYPWVWEGVSAGGNPGGHWETRDALSSTQLSLMAGRGRNCDCGPAEVDAALVCDTSGSPSTRIVLFFMAQSTGDDMASRLRLVKREILCYARLPSH